MDNVKIDIDEYRILKEKESEKPARRIELGGGYYYKCYWLSCDTTVNRFDNYCCNCGQHLVFPE